MFFPGVRFYCIDQKLGNNANCMSIDNNDHVYMYKTIAITCRCGAYQELFVGQQPIKTKIV